MEAAAGNPMDLTGATVLVAGASGGIGREIAILLSPLHARVAPSGRCRERRQQTRARLCGEGRRMDVFDLLRTNLHSAILLARGFRQKHCHATGSGMVLLSSVMGLVGTPMVSVYSGTKSALMGFARSLAVELANQRIRVNCSAPAFVRTEMLGQVKAMLSPERFAALEKAHPLGFGTPRDLANAVAFLLADTGRWITGSTLVVDGGHSAQ